MSTSLALAMHALYHQLSGIVLVKIKAVYEHLTRSKVWKNGRLSQAWKEKIRLFLTLEAFKGWFLGQYSPFQLNSGP